MSNEIKIKISTASDNTAIYSTEKALNGLDTSSTSVSKSLGSKMPLAMVAWGTALGVVATATYKFAEYGVKINSTFEQMRIGIASLIAVNSQNVTSTGEAINSAQKYQLAQAQSAEAIKDLRKANAETPATLQQLTAGYQSALAPALKYGMTTKQTVEYSKLMTQAAAAMGIELSQLPQEMRSILSAEIDNNSQVAKNIGLTNEQINQHKKQGDLYPFLISKLKDFSSAGADMANSWEGVSSNLEDTFDTIASAGSKPLFDGFKTLMSDLNGYLNSSVADTANAGAKTVNQAGKDTTTVAEQMGQMIAQTFYVLFHGVQTVFRSIYFAGASAFNGLIEAWNYVGGKLYEGFVWLQSKVSILLNNLAGLAKSWNSGFGIVLGMKVDTSGLQTEINKVNSAIQGNSLQVSKYNAVLNDTINENEKMALRFGKYLNSAINGWQNIGKETTKAIGVTGGLISATGKAGDESEKAGKKAKEAGKKAKEAIDKTNKSLEDEYSTLLKEIEALKEKRGLTADEIKAKEAQYIKDGTMAIREKIKAKKEEIELIKKEIEAKEEAQKQYEEMLGNINKAMDEQFFSVLTGKFESFGKWFKDMWSSISSSILRGVSRSLADLIVSSKGDGSGLLDGLIKSLFGGIAGSSVAVSAVNADGYSGTINQVVNAASGSAGSGLFGGLTSSISSVSSLFSGGFAKIGEYVTGLTTQVGTYAGNVAQFFGASQATVSSVASIASSVASYGIAGLAGFAVGSLGDALFGTNTKAGLVGGVGSMIGFAVGGPIGAAVGTALGSVLGGLFPSWEEKGRGYSFASDTSTGTDAKQYIEYEKDGWFTSSSKTTYIPLDGATAKAIKSTFDTYNMMLEQLDKTSEILLKKGKYTAENFDKALGMDFLSKVMDTPALKAIYDQWAAYAKSIDATVSQALSQAVQSFTTTKRTFETWTADRAGDSLKVLQLKAGYASADLNSLMKIYDIAGVTTDNFLDRYNEAIKSSFDPDTITKWNTLANALMNATDAQSEYTKALNLTANQSTPYMQDMMLSRMSNYSGQGQVSVANNQATMTSALIEILKVLKKQYLLEQRLAGEEA